MRSFGSTLLYGRSVARGPFQWEKRRISTFENEGQTRSTPATEGDRSQDQVLDRSATRRDRRATSHCATNNAEIAEGGTHSHKRIALAQIETWAIRSAILGIGLHISLFLAPALPTDGNERQPEAAASSSLQPDLAIPGQSSMPSTLFHSPSVYRYECPLIPATTASTSCSRLATKWNGSNLLLCWLVHGRADREEGASCVDRTAADRTYMHTSAVCTALI